MDSSLAFQGMQHVKEYLKKTRVELADNNESRSEKLFRVALCGFLGTIAGVICGLLVGVFGILLTAILGEMFPNFPSNFPSDNFVAMIMSGAIKLCALAGMIIAPWMYRRDMRRELEKFEAAFNPRLFLIAESLEQDILPFESDKADLETTRALVNGLPPESPLRAQLSKFAEDKAAELARKELEIGKGCSQWYRLKEIPADAMEALGRLAKSGDKAPAGINDEILNAFRELEARVEVERDVHRLELPKLKRA